MKKIVNILACLVFVILLTSVSFAKSTKKIQFVSVNTSVNCGGGGACENAREAAAGVAQDALFDCNLYGAGSQQCKDANAGARDSRENAAFICEVYPASGNVSYVPERDKIMNKFKTSGLNLLSRNAS